MSTVRAEAFNNPAASSGGLVISTTGRVSGGGLDLITSQSFSAVSTVSVDDCFCSDYTNYRVLVDFDASTAITLRMRLRASGTDATGSNYGEQETFGGSRGVGAYWTVGDGSTPATNACTVELFRPFLADSTAVMSMAASSIGNGYMYGIGGYHDVDTSYDGFTIYPSSGTITGTVYVYGYAKP